MSIVISILVAILSYLVGSLSFAVIVSRVMGLSDPRSYGSKNPGATNLNDLLKAQIESVKRDPCAQKVALGDHQSRTKMLAPKHGKGITQHCTKNDCQGQRAGTITLQHITLGQPPSQARQHDDHQQAGQNVFMIFHYSYFL